MRLSVTSAIRIDILLSKNRTVTSGNPPSGTARSHSIILVRVARHFVYTQSMRCATTCRTRTIAVAAT